jgi:hypothetical protein
MRSETLNFHTRSEFTHFFAFLLLTRVIIVSEGLLLPAALNEQIPEPPEPA